MKGFRGLSFGKKEKKDKGKNNSPSSSPNNNNVRKEETKTQQATAKTSETFKIAIIGPCSGKTTFVRSFGKWAEKADPNFFTDPKTLRPDLGEIFSEAFFQALPTDTFDPVWDSTLEEESSISLTQFDVPVQLRFFEGGSSYLTEHTNESWIQHQDAVLITFPVSNMKSWPAFCECVNRAINAQLAGNVPSVPQICLLGLRADEKWDFPVDSLASLAHQYCFPFYFCSSKSKKGFQYFVSDLVSNLRRRKRIQSYLQTLNLEPAKMFSFWVGNMEAALSEKIENLISIQSDQAKRTLMVDSIVNYSVAPLVRKIPSVFLRGPDMSETEQSIPSAFISAQSISTYPTERNSTIRQGDPICDQYGLIQFDSGRTLFALADGCGWGAKARDAARIAVDSLLQNFSRNQSEIRVTRDAARLLLRCFSDAHNKIVEGKLNHEIQECGTTTLVGGILLKIEPPQQTTPHTGTTPPPLSPRLVNRTQSTNSLSVSNSFISGSAAPASGSSSVGSSLGGSAPTAIIPPLSPIVQRSMSRSILGGSGFLWAKKEKLLKEDLHELCKEPPDSKYMVIAAALGDCKLYKREHSTGNMVEITKEHFERITDRNDCGGRIGPFVETTKPDLRNLQICSAFVEPGDMIICTSDGVHDNFGCSSLGITPRELKVPLELKEDDWKEVEVAIKLQPELGAKIDELRHEHFNTGFTKVVTKNRALSPTSLQITPSWVIQQVMPYCVATTEPSRKWMQTEKGKLPKDYKRFPGKMDHCSMLAFNVKRKQSTKFCIFGKNLQELMHEQRENPSNHLDIPELLLFCFEGLNISIEGIFRIAGNSQILRQIKLAVRPGKIDHTAAPFNQAQHFEKADLAKSFFAEMPGSFLGKHAEEVIRVMEGNNFAEDTSKIFAGLSKVEQTTARYLFTFLHKVATTSEKNKMTPRNLAVCWTPTLFQSSEMLKIGTLIDFTDQLIAKWDTIKF